MKKTTLCSRVMMAMAMIPAGVPMAHADVSGTHRVDADTADLHVNALMNGFRLYADAAGRRFVAEGNRSARPVELTQWINVERRLLDATFVTLFYTWNGLDGVGHSRTYFAMNSESRVEGALRDPVLSDDIEAWLDPRPGEVIASRQDDNASRIAWGRPMWRRDAPRDLQDAELKVVRSLERDLFERTVGDRGQATIIVSRPSCLPCSQAVHNFANAYHLDVIVKELSLPGPGVPGSAATVFHAKRRAYAGTIRNSVRGRARLRPTDLPGTVDTLQMCLVAPRIDTSPVTFVQQEYSAATTVVKAYAQLGDAARYLLDFSDMRYTGWVLASPTSPYSGRDDITLKAPTPVEKHAQSLFGLPEGRAGQRRLHDRKAWEFGYTKARPWTDVYDLYGAPWNTARGVPSHLKAWVDWHFMNGARNVTGADYPALAAVYAVGLALLAEKQSDHASASRAWLGMRMDIADRAMVLGARWTASSDELYYLAMIVDAAMHDWHVGAPAHDGSQPMLPVPFRVARTAAAFRDRLPYDSDPCLTPRQHNPATAGMGKDDRPLCFNDATDRAVYEWFVGELRKEMATANIADRGDAARFARVSEPLLHTIFGPHTLAPGALTTAYRQEVFDMQIAARLVGEGEMSPASVVPVVGRAVKIMTREGK